MQTTETHHALVLDPDGLAVPHLDGLHWALLRAQPAADAVVPDAEIRGAPCAVVHRLGYQLGDERRSARKHGRFVRRSLTPRIARPISASVVPVNLAVFSGVERSKTGVQVSGMRTE